MCKTGRRIQGKAVMLQGGYVLTTDSVVESVRLARILP